jgi:hypothetical protein
MVIFHLLRILMEVSAMLGTREIVPAVLWIRAVVPVILLVRVIVPVILWIGAVIPVILWTAADVPMLEGIGEFISEHVCIMAIFHICLEILPDVTLVATGVEN